MENFSSRIRQIRGSFSQAQAAEMAGIKQQNWARYEGGTVQPGAAALRQICVAFGVSADWLLGLSVSKSPKSGNTNSQISQAKLEGLKAAIRSLLDQY